MRPDLIVIRSVILQHSTQLHLVEHDEVVETFAPNRADEALVAFLSPLSRQRGAALAEPDRLQPREFVATAGAARADQEMVTNQLAAAVGEDRRTAHPTCALLLLLLAESHLTRRLFVGMLRKIAALSSPAGSGGLRRVAKCSLTR
jgi:hypothetical protein